MLAVVFPILTVAGCAANSGPSATRTAAANPGQFVLMPRWLPAGFSPSGGGYVDPPGGLQLNPGSEAVISVGSPQRSIPEFFGLSYYGYHNPVANLSLTAAASGIPVTGPFTTLGGRKVHLTSSIDTSGFVPIIDTSADLGGASRLHRSEWSSNHGATNGTIRCQSGRAATAEAAMTPLQLGRPTSL